MSAPPPSTASTTAEEILRGLGTASAAVSTAASSSVSYAASYATPENGSYTLNVLFYFFLYAFILFLILILVHFTMYPVFKFTPGAKGLIGISSTTDSIVYWNNKTQPTSYAPINNDKLSKYPFINNFSFSVDLFVRRMTDTTATTRVILYKTFANGQDPMISAPSTDQMNDITNTYMNSKVSMFMYLTKTNDLVVTFFNGPNGTPYSSRQIKNIPLYTPFRVTVVVEDKTFTVYINGRHVFQRTVAGTLALNSYRGLNTEAQRFFPPPSWADLPVKSIFLQNLHVWPRAITSSEVRTAQPALALESDFDMPKESGTSSCS